MCLCADARGLVSALLQPDPTVRLNAQQTLQNPWVTVMASTCSQRALPDKTHRSTAATGAEPDTVQGHAQTNAAVVMTEKTPGNRSDEGEITHKQLGRREMNTGRGQNEERPPQQQSEETITAQASQIKVHTPSGATPTDRQDSGSKLSDTDYNPGSPASPGVGLNPLDDPAALTDPPPRVKTQSKQNSQQPSPPYSQENTSRSRNATSPNLQTR